MMEILDRVDENDVVIGTTTKDEAHAQGYVHRVSAIYVFTEDGKLLVQLRKSDNLLDHSAAGHVDRGENYDLAASRELKEELGLSVPLEYVGKFYADERAPARTGNIVHYFGLYMTKPEIALLKSMVISEREIIKMIPMTIEEIVAEMLSNPMKFTTGFQYTLNFYAKQKELNIPVIPIT